MRGQRRTRHTKARRGIHAFWHQQKGAFSEVSTHFPKAPEDRANLGGGQMAKTDPWVPHQKGPLFSAQPLLGHAWEATLGPGLQDRDAGLSTTQM